MLGSAGAEALQASVTDLVEERGRGQSSLSASQVVSYLAGCGLQSCPMLLAKGYPDIGWNPCGGERYLDFLRFAVFVNGEASSGQGPRFVGLRVAGRVGLRVAGLRLELSPPPRAGESVEENANVVVRLLIRKPECFGPALRGEGGSGLLAAIEEAIRISEDPARDGPGVRRDRRREQ